MPQPNTDLRDNVQALRFVADAFATNPGPADTAAGERVFVQVLRDAADELETLRKSAAPAPHAPPWYLAGLALMIGLAFWVLFVVSSHGL